MPQFKDMADKKPLNSFRKPTIELPSNFNCPNLVKL